MTRFTLAYPRAALALALALAGALPATSFADAGAEARAGQALFMRNGCYECHGLVGQGSIGTGPALAPHPPPLAAMQAYVHAPKGQMPPYSARILSDADIARIHAYLDAIPANPRAAEIALLNDGAPPKPAPTGAGATNARAGDAGAANAGNGRGAALFAANCAGCHGQAGAGGVGPKLDGIAARLSLDGVAQRIREPSGIMPKLYPKPLDANDVQAVARYVMSLD